MTTIKVRGPKGCRALSHAGNRYTPDKNGLFEVPADFAAHARRHGFEVVEQRPTLTLHAVKGDAA